MENKTVEFKDNASATVYGWPDGFTAKFTSVSSITVGNTAMSNIESAATYQWKDKNTGFKKQSASVSR